MHSIGGMTAQSETSPAGSAEFQLDEPADLFQETDFLERHKASL
jgi:hypothetical protein